MRRRRRRLSCRRRRVGGRTKTHVTLRAAAVRSRGRRGVPPLVARRRCTAPDARSWPSHHGRRAAVGDAVPARRASLRRRRVESAELLAVERRRAEIPSEPPPRRAPRHPRAQLVGGSDQAVAARAAARCAERASMARAGSSTAVRALPSAARCAWASQRGCVHCSAAAELRSRFPPRPRAPRSPGMRPTPRR